MEEGVCLPLLEQPEDQSLSGRVLEVAVAPEPVDKEDSSASRPEVEVAERLEILPRMLVELFSLRPGLAVTEQGARLLPGRGERSLL
jgi:hypothetical protein